MREIKRRRRSKSFTCGSVLFAALAPSLFLMFAYPAGSSLAGGPAESARPTLIILMAGQSNMAGRGRKAGLEKLDSASRYASSPLNVRIWSPSDGRWVPVVPGETFGPEIGFAHAISEARPNQVFGLVKVARGSTNIEQWQPSTPLYSALLAQSRAARASSAGAELAALLWLQGESDADREGLARAYARNLAHLITSLRVDTETPELPVLIARISPGSRFRGVKRFDYASTVQDAQANVALAGVHSFPTDDLERNTYIVGESGTPGFQRSPRNEDGVHFSASGQIELGRRFAEAFLEGRSPDLRDAPDE